MAVELVASGMGVTCSIGQGKSEFADALLGGRHRFGVMRRPGRQNASAFLGAEIERLVVPNSINPHDVRTMSLSTKAAIVALHEAWEEASLGGIAPERIGLVIGGSNVQQRELTTVHDNYRDRVRFLRPTYALSFMDTDLCGACTQHFGIRGLAYTVGGASASGQVAIVQAAQAVRSGQVDVCIAVGALMDLSYWECQGFRTIGAMGSDRFADEPDMACRPFDRDRDGFIFGEMCGAVVVESQNSCLRRNVRPYAALQGWQIAMDGNRNPDPSLAGEKRAIQAALQMAGWKPSSVDYVNPHGTGSTAGDAIELQALRECELGNARINATKALIGHGLSAAGTVEVIATLLQMRAGQLHPSRNLENPIDDTFQWVGRCAEPYTMQRALTMSMGFGGINTALCWQRPDRFE